MSTLRIGGQAKLLVDYRSFDDVVMTAGESYSVRRVNDDGSVELEHPQTGGRVFFLAREVDVLPDPHGWNYGRDKRFWRVSAFGLGFESMADTPHVHRRSHRPENIKKHFDLLCKQLGIKFGAVIVHQGNLSGKAYKVHERREVKA